MKQPAGRRASSTGVGGGGGNGSKQFPAIDFRDGRNVRDQGKRGTCVAHALAAVREFGCAGGADIALSPQFLFWASKTHGRDPEPDKDGTRLEYAKDALASLGVCEESHWGYVARVKRSNITHGPPPALAVQKAKPYAHSSRYECATQFVGNAAKVIDAMLDARAPVAISLPTFADSLTARIDNWSNPLAEAFGFVIDPPRGAIVVSGHAVCVTGFVPDSAEYTGGYFVFRNSWGTQWGAGVAHAPPSHRQSPEPGYGCVSATYVDTYLWELCRLDVPASAAP